MTNRETLALNGYEDAVVFEAPDFDPAIVGVTTDGIVLYDLNRMVEHMAAEDGITEEEALEFIEYNTIRACGYCPGAPIIIETWIEEL